MSLFYRENPGREPFNSKRKAWHLLGFMIPAIYYFDLFDAFGVFSKPTAAWGSLLLIILATVTIILDIIRLNSKRFSDFFVKSVGFLMKESEKDRLNATGPFLLANGIAILFFPREIAVMTSIFLLLGDTMAAWYGGRYGYVRFVNNKSVAGAMAGFFTGIGFGLLFLIFHYSYMPYSLALSSTDVLLGITVITLGSAAAMLAEFWTGHLFHGLIDDNLTIPVVSGIVMTVFTSLLQGTGWFTLFSKISDVF